MAPKRKQFKTEIDIGIEGVALNVHSNASLDKTALTAVRLLNTITGARSKSNDYR